MSGARLSIEGYIFSDFVDLQSYGVIEREMKRSKPKKVSDIKRLWEIPHHAIKQQKFYGQKSHAVENHEK